MKEQLAASKHKLDLVGSVALREGGQALLNEASGARMGRFTHTNTSQPVTGVTQRIHLTWTSRCCDPLELGLLRDWLTVCTPCSRDRELGIEGLGFLLTHHLAGCVRGSRPTAQCGLSTFGQRLPLEELALMTCLLNATVANLPVPPTTLFLEQLWLPVP